MGSQQLYDSVFTPEQISYITKRVATAAKEVLGNKMVKVILYGSYARGDYHEWSDVDIMVLADIDDTQSVKYRDAIDDRIWDLVYQMNLLLSITIVPILRFEHFKGALPFYKNVEMEGVPVYD